MSLDDMGGMEDMDGLEHKDSHMVEDMVGNEEYGVVSEMIS